ncbi:MAG TPA: hypothetical protein VH328_16320 [Burkholderiaceae bacterium]|nr:hypothetical protein [Burkholderiaceae bacterium]
MIGVRIGGLLATSLVVVASAASSQEQKLRWNGFYAGINAGAVGANNQVVKSASESATGGLSTALNLGFFPLNSAPNNGFIGGAQAGYMMMPAIGLVLGGETDMQYINAQTTVASSPFTYAAGSSSPRRSSSRATSSAAASTTGSRHLFEERST